MDKGYDYDYNHPMDYSEDKKLTPLDRQIGGSHYKKYKIQPAEYMHANEIPFLEGEAISYITRWRDKNGIPDLRKAIHILEILIQLEEAKKKNEQQPVSAAEYTQKSIGQPIAGPARDRKPGEWFEATRCKLAINNPQKGD